MRSTVTSSRTRVITGGRRSTVGVRRLVLVTAAGLSLASWFQLTSPPAPQTPPAVSHVTPAPSTLGDWGTVTPVVSSSPPPAPSPQTPAPVPTQAAQPERAAVPLYPSSSDDCDAPGVTDPAQDDPSC